MYKGFRRIFGRRRSSSIFERFTERARKAVVLAQEEARRFRHSLESARRDVEPPEFTPNQPPFRRRVESLRIAVRPGDQPQTPLVNLDHIYAWRVTEDARTFRR